MNPKSLSTMHLVIREGAHYVRRYRLDLDGGGVLVVRMPASLSRGQAIEVVGQLSELADAIEKAHGLFDEEPSARQELLLASETLGQAMRQDMDLEAARDLLAQYDLYRQASVDYLRAIGRQRFETQ